MKPDWSFAPVPKPAPRRKARPRPLPYRSAKRQLEANEREHVRLVVARRQGYRCFARGLLAGECRSPHGHRPDLEIHEVKTRGRGGSDLNINNCIGLCQIHHDWVTEHPREAHDLGLVRHSWEPEPDEPLTPGVTQQGGTNK